MRELVLCVEKCAQCVLSTPSWMVWLLIWAMKWRSSLLSEIESELLMIPCALVLLGLIQVVVQEFGQTLKTMGIGGLC